MYAKWTAYAHGRVEGSKISRLAQWKQVEKTTDKAPQGLESQPEFPSELLYLWVIFNKVAGRNDLTYVEIDAYMRLMQESLTPWEINILFKLEAVRNG